MNQRDQDSTEPLPGTPGYERPRLDRPVVTRRPARSAGHLVWGLVVLLPGQWLYSAGQAQALESSLRPFSDSAGQELMLLGGLGSFVGFALLAVGVHRLASHVDRLAGAR